MSAIKLSTRKVVAASCLLLVLVGGYFLWNWLTKPTGNQQVSFTSAQSQHFTSDNSNYTIYRAPTGVSEDVIYYLHGRNLDDSIWNDDTYFTSQVQAFWQKSAIKPPTVVIVSYGSVWLLTPKNSKVEYSLMDDFIARLPEIEAKSSL